MRILRLGLGWIAFVAIMATAGALIRAMTTGTSLQDQLDRLNWEFLAAVTSVPIGLVIAIQAAVAVVGFTSRRIGSAKREAEAKEAAWKAFAEEKDD